MSASSNHAQTEKYTKLHGPCPRCTNREVYQDGAQIEKCTKVMPSSMRAGVVQVLRRGQVWGQDQSKAGLMASPVPTHYSRVSGSVSPQALTPQSQSARLWGLGRYPRSFCFGPLGADMSVCARSYMSFARQKGR